jgi:hypothetical protein
MMAWSPLLIFFLQTLLRRAFLFLHLIYVVGWLWTILQDEAGYTAIFGKNRALGSQVFSLSQRKLIGHFFFVAFQTEFTPSDLLTTNS